MSEQQEPSAHPTPFDVAPALVPATHAERASRRRTNHAELMLLITTAVWGSSFALAKDAGEAINSAAGDGRHALGPVAVLAIRFAVASVVWAALVPRARTGWTGKGVRDGAIVGGLLACGAVLQHLALDRTIEAVAAFLTSLTVIFVPLILWLVLRQPLAPIAWLGVAIAVPGVWLMSGPAGASGFTLGVGELLGIACAFVFAWHLMSVNLYTPRHSPWQMCLAQFVTVAVVCGLLVPLCAIGVDGFEWGVLGRSVVWQNVLLLVAGPTLVSFGLMAVYQPLVSPVRAVLIYLLEPVFAALFAWFWSGRTMSREMMVGGALIMVANVLVELWPMLRNRRGRANGRAAAGPS